ncbi:MAG TPA: thermonuclease family protein, partial [Acidimicrobiales bacterium]|nr:thermonuclease family protein [Acidimicrobiales bacterium]
MPSRPHPRRSPLRRGGTVLAAATTAVLVTGLAACTAPRHPQAVAVPGGGRGLPATVTHVVDGDTVDLAIGGATERARLLGIDTPETVKPNAPVDCFGPEASARTKALLPDGTAVVVQRDREARDRYG